MIRRRRYGAAATIVALLVGVLAVPAVAQDAEVRIRQAVLDDDGATKVVVGVDGIPEGEILTAGAFQVFEQGQPVGDLTVTPLLESEEQPISIALVIDVSFSLVGQPIADARDGAREFVRELGDVPVTLITFSTEINRLTDFTTDVATLLGAIDGIEAGGRTSLFDAVLFAAQQFGDRPGLRSIVLFADGEDNNSAVTLDEAIAAAHDANAEISVAILQAPSLDEEPLLAMAAQTGGKAISVDDSAALVGAFEELARQIASQYVITYQGAITEPAELALAVAVTHGGVTATDEIIVLNPRLPAPVPPGDLPAVVVPGPMFEALANPVGVYVGLGAAFLALVMLLGVAVAAAVPGRATQVLRDSLSRAGSSGRRSTSVKQGVRGSATRRAIELVDRVPKPRGFEQSIQLKVERAGWSLRATEFLVLQVVAAILGAGFFSLLISNWVGIGIGVIVGTLAPRAYMAWTTSRRQSAFAEQLSDTLQILAGSLRAGYGVLQAIDTVVKEADEPTASEFARVLTEARLGMPLEEALEAMADRLDSEDFRWAVLAINIQRQVGGNLAALFETVAATLRERSQLRRQVKTLSAEGRLSALILTLLPFGLAAYMILVNPEYMALLVSRFMGLVMVFTAFVLMGAGIFWMRKMVRIEV